MDEFDFSGRNQPSNGYSVPPGYAAPPKHTRDRSISNSRMWYLAFLPLFSLVLEVFAENIVTGAFLWIITIAAMWLCCKADRDYIKSKGVDISSLKVIDIILSPVYAFKRCKLTHCERTAPIVFCVCLLYALTQNSFVYALTMDEDDIVYSIQYKAVYQLSGFENDERSASNEYVYSIIELYSQRITGAEYDLYSDEELSEWTAVRNDDDITVTASSESANFSVVITASFDGYTFTNIEIASVTLGEKSYTGNDAADAFSTILDIIEEEYESSDSSGSEKAPSSSNEEYKSV
ncbi:MAG: hypothetical protein LUE12_08635 [Ruminococcus sp.]|nr:hypothetical protein [Ruminococcus sp.]